MKLRWRHEKGGSLLCIFKRSSFPSCILFSLFLLSLVLIMYLRFLFQFSVLGASVVLIFFSVLAV